MRDQWRLPPCMSPKPFKAPKKGFIHKAMGSLQITAADPRWYQGFQKYPHIWDDMCRSEAGKNMKRCQPGEFRKFNASVTEEGAFRLWQQKRILARPRMANTPKNLVEEYQCRFLATVEWFVKVLLACFNLGFSKRNATSKSNSERVARLPSKRELKREEQCPK